MKNKLLMPLAAIVMVVTIALSCSKDKNNCVKCTAICAGSEVDELDYCGENTDEEEATFRSQYSGCEVSCSR